MLQKIVISSAVVALGFLLFVNADVSHLGESSKPVPIPIVVVFFYIFGAVKLID
jgi:hypothetical protein